MKRIIILTLIFIVAVIILGFTRFDLMFKIKTFNPQILYKRMTYKPTVSVIVPSYNMMKTLPTSINSIINQTYTDWELLVINDGSFDETREVLKPYYSNYKIRIIHNRKNLGLIRTLNKGIRLAKGKYIARLDADDISLPDRLERQVTIMDREDLDFLSQTHYYTDKIRYEKADNFDTYSNGVELFMRVYFSHSAVMMKKSFLTKNNLKYDLKYTYAEDYDLWLAIFYKGGKIGAMGGQPISVYYPATHTIEYLKQQRYSTDQIRIHYLSKIIPNFDPYKILPLPFCELLPIIIDGNKTTKVLNQQELEKQYKLKCTNP